MRGIISLLAAAALCLAACRATGEEPGALASFRGGADPREIGDWLQGFAEGLRDMEAEPERTRARDYIQGAGRTFRYAFGSVHTRTKEGVRAEAIDEIRITSPEIVDYRDAYVGLSLAGAARAAAVGPEDEPAAAVLADEKSGTVLWAHSEKGVLTELEWVCYAPDADGVACYSAGYLLDEAGRVTEIALRFDSLSREDAGEAMEAASRMYRERLLSGVALRADEGEIGGARVLGRPVDVLIGVLGDPVRVVPAQGGRVLVYDGATVSLALEEETGEEIVRRVEVRSRAIEGPRGLRAGIPLRQAVRLFRHEGYSGGPGLLYREGAAFFGELAEVPDGRTLRYSAGPLQLEASVAEDAVAGFSMWLEE